MRIGIKYCGGCNPVYNRGRQVKRLQEQYPEHEFDFAAGDMKEGEIGLVVCGCVRACASVDGLAPKKKLFLLPTCLLYTSSGVPEWDFLKSVFGTAS